MKRTTTTLKAYLGPHFAPSTHLDPISHGGLLKQVVTEIQDALCRLVVEAQSKAVDRNLFWCRLRGNLFKKHRKDGGK